MRNRHHYRIRDLEDVNFEKKYLEKQLKKQEKDLTNGVNEVKDSLGPKNILSELLGSAGRQGEIIAAVIPYIFKYKDDILKTKVGQNITAFLSKKSVILFISGAIISSLSLYFIKNKATKKNNTQEDTQ